MIYLVVEPLIDQAIAIEDARETHGGQSAPIHLPMHGDEPLVSRGQQVVFGALTAFVVAILIGLIFAVVYAKTRHRLPGAGDFWRSVTLAVVGFSTVALLPAITIPANPPAVGDEATVDRRTMLYLLSILVGVAIALAVPMFDRWLAGRDVAVATRWAVDIAVTLVAVVLVLELLPGSPDSVPPDMPATLLWEFRLASLAQLGAQWLTLGVVFGLLMQRVPAPASADEAQAAVPANA
jgi:predicted cobalt transporter CbtA